MSVRIVLEVWSTDNLLTQVFDTAGNIGIISTTFALGEHLGMGAKTILLLRSEFMIFLKYFSLKKLFTSKFLYCFQAHW